MMHMMMRLNDVKLCARTEMRRHESLDCRTRVMRHVSGEEREGRSNPRQAQNLQKSIASLTRGSEKHGHKGKRNDESEFICMLTCN